MGLESSSARSVVRAVLVVSVFAAGIWGAGCARINTRPSDAVNLTILPLASRQRNGLDLVPIFILKIARKGTHSYQTIPEHLKKPYRMILQSGTYDVRYSCYAIYEDLSQTEIALQAGSDYQLRCDIGEHGSRLILDKVKAP